MVELFDETIKQEIKRLPESLRGTFAVALGAHQKAESIGEPVSAEEIVDQTLRFLRYPESSAQYEKDSGILVEALKRHSAPNPTLR